MVVLLLLLLLLLLLALPTKLCGPALSGKGGELPEGGIGTE